MRLPWLLLLDELLISIPTSVTTSVEATTRPILLELCLSFVINGHHGSQDQDTHRNLDILARGISFSLLSNKQVNKVCDHSYRANENR